MENRVPYRRITPAKNRSNMYEKPPDDQRLSLTFKDNLAIQLAISGLLMMALVVIALANTSDTNRLRGGLTSALTGATTPGELIDDIRAFVGQGTPEEVAEFDPPEVFEAEAEEPAEGMPSRIPVGLIGE